MRNRNTRVVAKLFMHGRSQAVRLPKAFRFDGAEVRLSKVGSTVTIEPLESSAFDVQTWRAKLDTYLDISFDEVADDRVVPYDPIAFD